jgi:hypothetical protein
LDQGFIVKITTPLGRMKDIVIKNGYKKTMEFASEFTVIEIKIDGNNFYYGIEYWYNGEIKTVHLNENEIEKYKEKKI